MDEKPGWHSLPVRCKSTFDQILTNAVGSRQTKPNITNVAVKPSARTWELINTAVCCGYDYAPGISSLPLK